IVAMALCGLWHGAAWTMVAWGVWHGVLLAAGQGPLRKLFAPSEEEKGAASPARVLLGLVSTWVLVNAGWLLFRAGSLHQAASMAQRIVTLKGGVHPAIVRENSVLFVFATLLALICVYRLRRPLTAFFGEPQLARPDSQKNWLAGALRPAVYTM